MITPLEEFYYGSLMTMKTEYLVRTATKALGADYIEIEDKYDTNFGDDRVEITSYEDDEEGNPRQLYKKTFRSSLCYEVASILANETRNRTAEKKIPKKRTGIHQAFRIESI